MNKNFIMECIDIIEQIELDSIITITKDNEELKYQLKYDEEFKDFNLECLDKENEIWDFGETIENIKESLACDAVSGKYQKIRLVEEEKLIW